MQYGKWNELKLETLTPKQKDLLGVKLSEFPLMTFNHLGKRIKKLEPAIHGVYTPMLY